MRITSGRVIAGRIEVDAELPEGSPVTVLAADGDETFLADQATEQALLESIEQCVRGQTLPLQRVLDRLRETR